MGIRLSDGNRVCIIGGGPAGCFAALHLLNLARHSGLRLEVMIFEPRDFTKPGPGGCNSCAGVLSTRLMQGMETLGISIPNDVIQSEVLAYTAHLDGEVVRITKPNPQQRIVSVYRGGGPRLIEGDSLASFDAYLLKQATLMGAEHIPSRILKVTWDGQPVVHTARDRFQSDFVVLATGVNSRSPLAADFGYHPPQTTMMAQDEIRRPPTWPTDEVSVFFKYPPGLIFGTLIPKGDFINISLLGEGFTKNSVDDFIEIHGLDASILNSPYSLCGCTPRFAVGSARGYYGNRWVAVGDAAVTRHYKDGIGSAFYTAKTAMQTAINHGISQRAFRNMYVPYCRSVVKDNFYGRMLFFLWNFTLRNQTIIRAWKNLIKMEEIEDPGKQIHIRLLWGMFTGDEPYRELFKLFLSWKSMRGLIRGLRNSSTEKGV